MFRGFVRVYGAINPKRVPENSIGLRLSILAAILAAELTILAMGYYGTANIIGVPALTAAGFAYSWRTRLERNLLGKFILSLLVLGVSVLFVRELATNIYDTRLPLIKLLLWLQVLHSFDVPARRDLKFSLASGLTLIAAGAVLSTGMAYIVGLAGFCLTASIALVFLHVSERSQQADRSLQARPVQMIAYGAAAAIAGIALAVPLLLMMPHSSQAKLHSLPLSDLQKFFGDFPPEVVNPFYADGGNPFDRPPQFSPDSYYGFNPYMDLRSRGNLSDDIVLKVRSDGYSLYRGVVFDRYNGKGWEMSTEAATDISTDTAPLTLDIPDSPVYRVKTNIQSFYVQADLPNIIFASWKPEQLFFPASTVKLDEFNSIRSPFQLAEGTVYSVISAQPVYEADALRRFPRANDIQAAAGYTELPYNSDLGEVARLARQVTEPYDTRYDKVQAIERYLRENYSYDLDIAPQSGDRDAVAYFLFDEKRGYCEHFASAMAVMARGAGIPARVVTGYTGGAYNPFTALWEIKQSDAHAWVEIYFGSSGWVPFDPTPGFEIPEAAQDQSQDPWLAGKIFSYIGDTLGNGPIGSVASSVGGAFKSAVSTALTLPLALLAGAAAASVAAIWAGPRLLRRALRERRRRRLVEGSLAENYPRDDVLKDYFELAVRLQRRGLCRRPEETLREFARRVSLYLDAAEFAELSLLVERVRYEEACLPEPSRLKARELALKIRGKLEAATGLS